VSAPASAPEAANRRTARRLMGFPLSFLVDEGFGSSGRPRDRLGHRRPVVLTRLNRRAIVLRRRHPGAT